MSRQRRALDRKVTLALVEVLLKTHFRTHFGAHFDLVPPYILISGDLLIFQGNNDDIFDHSDAHFGRFYICFIDSVLPAITFACSLVITKL